MMKRCSENEGLKIGHFSYFNNGKLWQTKVQRRQFDF